MSAVLPNKLRSLARLVDKRLPQISKNVSAARNYNRLLNLLQEKQASARVLVVGGGILGEGMTVFLSQPRVELVKTDVYFGPRAQLICDAHDIPFANDTFDAVIVQAVLEHVVDPFRCVEEIHRVLGEKGLVYAETPFMFPVHMGRFDFLRFSPLAHRRLFRHFEEVSSGCVCGPGVALALAYSYFLMSFAKGRTSRKLLQVFSRLTSFYFKYFDSYLMKKPGGYDAASGVFFLGRRSSSVLSDHALVSQYRGAIADAAKGNVA